MNNNNYAYVTFADNEVYLKLAYALALSLYEVNSKYELCVMIPEEIECLEFCNQVSNLPVVIRKVPYLFFNFLEKYWQNITINKFHAFSLIEYNKICFLDADLYVINNIDYIFDLPTPAIGIYTNDKKETCLSTGIFVIQPNLSFYSVLLNLCISLNFFDDENVFYYLAQQKSLLTFNTYLNQICPKLYQEDLVQEQGSRDKYFSHYSYEKIKQLAVRKKLLEQFNII